MWFVLGSGVKLWFDSNRWGGKCFFPYTFLIIMISVSFLWLPYEMDLNNWWMTSKGWLSYDLHVDWIPMGNFVRYNDSENFKIKYLPMDHVHVTTVESRILILFLGHSAFQGRQMEQYLMTALLSIWKSTTAIGTIMISGIAIVIRSKNIWLTVLLFDSFHKHNIVIQYCTCHEKSRIENKHLRLFSF